MFKRDLGFITSGSPIRNLSKLTPQVIDSPVTNTERYYDEAGVKVSFNGGNFHIWAENEISKCLRPANLIIDCEVCFNLKNEYGQHIGYLYIDKESAK